MNSFTKALLKPLKKAMWQKAPRDRTQRISMDAGDTERGFNRLSGRDLVGLMQESGAVTHATLQPLDVDMEV